MEQTKVIISREYTAEQVRLVCNCPESFLKDLTRTKGTRPPIFNPTWPSAGRGNKDLYSFKDLITLSTLVFARNAKLERKYLFAFSKLSNKLIESWPVHPYLPTYFDDIQKNRTHKDPELEYLMDSNAPTISVGIIVGDETWGIYEFYTENWKGYFKKTTTTTKTWGYFVWHGKDEAKAEKEFSAEKMSHLEDTLPFKVVIDLNKIHYQVRMNLKLQGLEV